MNIRTLLTNFITQICEKKFSQANQTLDTIVTEKVKTRIKKEAEKQKAVKGAKKLPKR